MGLLNRFVKTRFARKLIVISKRIKPPGFVGASLYDALSVFYNEVRDTGMTQRAASISFFLLLALFPGVLFLFTLIPYIPVAGFKTTLLNQMQAVLPGDAFAFLDQAIAEIISIQRLDLLSIGFVLAFIASANGVNSIMRSFNKTLPTFRKRSFWQKRLASIKLTAVLFGMLLLSVVLIIGGRAAVSGLTLWLGIEGGWAVVAIQVLRWVIIVLLFFFAIATIYYLGPARVKPWRLVSPGATVATVLSIAASLGFTVFVNKFDVYNEVFGAIGAFLAMMLWTFINCLVLLVGFEINTSIDLHRAHSEP